MRLLFVRCVEQHPIFFMRKYFDVIGPAEYRRYKPLDRVKKIDIAVVQLKKDGSNLLKFGDNYLTRSLAQALPQWREVIKSHFPEIERSRYDFYFEFGGTRNSPAGFTKCWDREWDYRVLDYYTYRYPLDELEREGLKIIETIKEFGDILTALEFAIKELHNWSHCEGLVVKAYGVQGDHEILRDGVLFFKVKHDNVGKWLQLLTASGGEEFERAPSEEIRKEVQKIVVEEIARGRRLEQIDLNSIWGRLEMELAKHGYKLTPDDRTRVKNILVTVKRELRQQLL